MSANDVLLELERLEKRYESPDGAPTDPVLRDVSLAVPAGDSIAVVGPSGSGKSTLLNIIGGLDRPSAGAVRLDGRNLATLTEQQLAEVRNRDIGFVFQLHHLLPQCTVLENVLIPTLPRGGADDEDAGARARDLLARVGLQDRLDYAPGRLSGGERQRTAVVRALINRPKLLLADEPTGSLDRASAEVLTQLLAELNAEQQTTLILVTHSMDLAQRMNRRFDLCDGRLEERQ